MLDTLGKYFKSLKPENTLTEELQGRLHGASDGLIRNILAAFLFKGDDVHKKVRHLSGGEKSVYSGMALEFQV